MYIAFGWFDQAAKDDLASDSKTLYSAVDIKKPGKPGSCFGFVIINTI